MTTAKKRRGRPRGGGGGGARPEDEASGDGRRREGGRGAGRGGATATATTTWESVPGTRLAVDLAGDVGGGGGRRGRKRARGGGRADRDDDDGGGEDGDDDGDLLDDDGDLLDDDEEEDAFDASKWTSRHYDDPSDDDEGGGGRNESGEAGGEAERDLFDPDPDATTNAFDAGSKAEGAGDAGMFVSLEVIPGDSYRVEKSGDERGGYVTKVVFATDGGPDAPPPSTSPPPPPPESEAKEERTPSAKEREKVKGKRLKRKARKERARERTRLKREEASGRSGDGAPPRASGGASATAPSSSAAPSTAPRDEASGEAEAADREVEREVEREAEHLRTTWSISAPGVSLHSALCRGLRSLKYAHPTPIQSATLPAAILGRRDIVGAAPTGSGKTLSFGLPILQRLLEEDDEDGDGDVAGEGGATPSRKRSNGPTPPRPPLRALILVPTRELALQVSDELRKVSRETVSVGTIVGGFAEAKQKRTLEKIRPQVVVGTPGRLWELISSGEYSHLNDLSRLRFLVVDEADRMIKQGSFPQLRQIFEVINRANPPPVDPATLEEERDDNDEDEDRLPSLRGVRGEAKVVMLDESVLAGIERERSGSTEGKPPSPMEMDDDEYERQRKMLREEEEESASGDSDDGDEEEPVHRQTFVYSATLTLPPSMHHLIKKDPGRVKPSKRKRGKKQAAMVEGAIAEILDAAGARGETPALPAEKKGATCSSSCAASHMPSAGTMRHTSTMGASSAAATMALPSLRNPNARRRGLQPRRLRERRRTRRPKPSPAATGTTPKPIRGRTTGRR